MLFTTYLRKNVFRVKQVLSSALCFKHCYKVRCFSYGAFLSSAYIAHIYLMSLQILQIFKNPFLSGEMDWAPKLTLRELIKISLENIVQAP